ncbi:hypothetical protein [Janthinobacterium sp. CG3]|uniref:hypothetical protein n=2 Tax=unclassified Janthinobacterium TaxID=2610881 RepID=UPI0012F75BDE|nr:hypothetical protein [Janthinobacterium sp. CG3]
MTNTLNTQRMGAVLLTGAVHLALLYAFLQSHHPLPAESAQPERAPIQWFILPLPATRPSGTSAAPLPPVPRRLPAAARTPAPRRGAPRAPTEAATITPDPVTVAPPAAAADPAAAPLSVDEIMRIAKRDIGKIDKQLRKEHPQRGEQAPLDTPQARLEKGFAAAHAAVRPKFYEAARTEELTMPGSSGSRIYKVTTAVLSYCIQIKPDGERIYLLTCPN